MQNLAHSLSALQALHVSALAAVWLRLWRQGLAGTYPVFFWYIAFRVVRAGTLAVIPTTSGLFYNIWMTTEPLLWLFHIALVREVYTRVLRGYSGVSAFAGILFNGALAVGLFLAFAAFLPNVDGMSMGSAWLLRFVLVSRTVQLFVLGFSLILLVFFAWFPAPLKRNLVLHTFVLTLYFLSASMAYLVFPLLPKWAYFHANMFVSFLSAASACLWLLLSRAGEEFSIDLRGRATKEDRAAALRKLDAFNEQLLRLVRK